MNSSEEGQHALQKGQVGMLPMHCISYTWQQPGQIIFSQHGIKVFPTPVLRLGSIRKHIGQSSSVEGWLQYFTSLHAMHAFS
jgi:hypothetical protein